jgi:hypothetical protein
MNFNEAKDYLYNRYKYVFKEMKFPSIYERKELGYDNNYYTVMVFNYYTVMVFYKDRIVAYEFLYDSSYIKPAFGKFLDNLEICSSMPDDLLEERVKQVIEYEDSVIKNIRIYKNKALKEQIDKL